MRAFVTFNMYRRVSIDQGWFKNWLNGYPSELVDTHRCILITDFAVLPKVGEHVRLAEDGHLPEILASKTWEHFDADEYYNTREVVRVEHGKNGATARIRCQKVGGSYGKDEFLQLIEYYRAIGLEVQETVN